MKIEPRRTQSVLEDATGWHGFLFHGEDAGLIHERAALVAKQVVPSLDDPFRVVILDRETQSRFEEEATALSLTGGRRLVWLRDAQDNVLSLLESALASDTDTMLILEAHGLATRSKLRTAMEKRPDMAVIACYPDEGRNLEAAVRAMFAEAQVRVDSRALAWLLNVLPADRALVRQEVGKLILYADPQTPLLIDDVQQCVGDLRAESLGNAVSFALAGERALSDEAIERALADGAVPVAIARACSSALLRLLTVRQAMDDGLSVAEAERSLRPPLFFKVAERFRVAVRKWDQASLRAACAATQELEFACKQSGSPDTALARRHVAKLCFGPRGFSL